VNAPTPIPAGPDRSARSVRSDTGASCTDAPVASGSADAPLDCLIVGAGPGGLTAATYLCRFHRAIAVVDAGASRARWIPTSHNCPGFPFGIAGPALLAKLREQAEGYGAVITPGRITALRREGEHFVADDDRGRHWHARHVLLATGIVDRMPAMEQVAGATAEGTGGRWGVGDAYRAGEEGMAGYGPADEAIRHAAFLRTFSRRVTALPSGPGVADAACATLAASAQVAVTAPVTRLQRGVDGCIAHFADGGQEQFDTVYPVLGGDAQAALATSLGARVDDNGELHVDEAMQTSVDGLYAVGDIVSALNQISVAVGHAAIAATAIHNRLPRNFREHNQDDPRQP